MPSPVAVAPHVVAATPYGPAAVLPGFPAPHAVAAAEFPSHLAYVKHSLPHLLDPVFMDAAGVPPEVRQPWTLHTPITKMMDSARDNIAWAMEYLTQHPVPDFDGIMSFLKDTADTLSYFRIHSIYGMETQGFLEKVQKEIRKVMDDLDAGATNTEHVLARYLHVALQEIDVARYLEVHATWPDGVAMVGPDGEFTPDDAHSQFFLDRLQASQAHDFYGAFDDLYGKSTDYLDGWEVHPHPTQHGIEAPYLHHQYKEKVYDEVLKHQKIVHHAGDKKTSPSEQKKAAAKKADKGQKQNEIDVDSNEMAENGADDDKEAQKTVINIEGPVFIGGKGSDLAELVREAMTPKGEEAMLHLATRPTRTSSMPHMTGAAPARTSTAPHLTGAITTGTSAMNLAPTMYDRMNLLNKGMGVLDGVLQNIGTQLPQGAANWVQGISSGIRGMTGVATAATGLAQNKYDPIQYANLMSGLGGMTTAVGKVANNWSPAGQGTWASNLAGAGGALTTAGNLVGAGGTLWNYKNNYGKGMYHVPASQMLGDLGGYLGGAAAGEGAMRTAWYPTNYTTNPGAVPQQLMNLSQGPAPVQMARKPRLQPVNYNPALPPQPLMSLAQMPNYGYNNYMALQQGAPLY